MKQKSLLSFFAKPLKAPQHKKQQSEKKSFAPSKSDARVSFKNATNDADYVENSGHKTCPDDDKDRVESTNRDSDASKADSILEAGVTSKPKEDLETAPNEQLDGQTDTETTHDTTDSADVEESSDSDSDDDDNNQIQSPADAYQKSAYELKREEKIARNNARLRELGLLQFGGDGMQPKRPNNNSKKNKQRKKAKVALESISIPTRRSTRLRKSSGGNDQSSQSSFNGHVSASSTTNVHEDEIVIEPEEEFTVAPFFEYQMDNGSAAKNQSTVSSAVEMKTLHPTGHRLLPPSGLNAIYSLQFLNQPSCNNNNNDVDPSWLVGAGKSGLVSLWDCNARQGTNNMETDGYVEPCLSWKAHRGRWIADARFVATSDKANQSQLPRQLLTAGNDGTLCHWDLTTTSFQTGAPKLLAQTNKSLHSSGIFSMDVNNKNNNLDPWIATGSKDKTVAVSTLTRLGSNKDGPIWRSHIHSAKVGCVSLSSSASSNPLIASASDDGLVAIHDMRLDATNNDGVVAQLDNCHYRPHSVVWKPQSEKFFVTAGLDDVIKLWDLRKTCAPYASFHGHVPSFHGKKLKRIHRPTFFNDLFLLSGGQGSHSISIFKMDLDSTTKCSPQSVFSRGKLPDVGDIGSIAVSGRRVAVAVEGGEVLLLSPNSN